MAEPAHGIRKDPLCPCFFSCPDADAGSQSLHASAFLSTVQAISVTRSLKSLLPLTTSVLALAGCASLDARWPSAHTPYAPDAALEARVEQILAGMSLAQKVGQMTQPEIKHITPEQVARWCIGSVLNGGGSWPGNDKYANAAAWLKLAQAYHEASLRCEAATPVPLLWGTDAVHGHNNVFGATIFPHNIGLGATRDPALLREIGAATARAVRATGIRWVFAPTLAVVQDDRWGRTYESYSEDPALVAQLGGAMVAGLQGDLQSEGSVLATAKHFIGDGGTAKGRDQGVTVVDAQTLLRLHGAGYYAAFAAGAQTVMASFNSWTDAASGTEHGKLHGSHELLTVRLKQQMGFDGFVVSDWNGIGQVKGCSNASCAQAINAGIDMVMVPEEWQAFIGNTVAQVQRGEIAMSRIDDAVRRIVRVKLRAGLLDASAAPAASRHAGKDEALQARELARRAVRESLVLLKNERGLLPLSRSQRLLVVGKSADSLENQSGGWTLSWQGTGSANQDFPAGQSVLAALRETLGPERVRYSADGRGVSAADFDAVIAVIGETPYAEGNGDIPPSGTLQHTSRHPEDLAVLRAAAALGKPVVTVFLSGRPLWVNDLLNLSDAFVAAWLPGSEGGGVADLLLRGADGRIAHEFRGRLPFSWPREACQTPLNAGDGQQPLFPLGFGLGVAQAPVTLGRLAETLPGGGCEARTEVSIFARSAQPPYQLQVTSPSQAFAPQTLGDDLNATLQFPSGSAPVLTISTVQLNTQQDAKLLRWQGPARLQAWAAQKAALGAFPDAALVFDLQLHTPPRGAVTLAMDKAVLELAPLLRGMAVGEKRRIAVPLACFAARGADLARVEIPFALVADAPFTAAIAQIRVQAGAATSPDAVACDRLSSPSSSDSQP